MSGGHTAGERTDEFSIKQKGLTFDNAVGSGKALIGSTCTRNPTKSSIFGAKESIDYISSAQTT
jgi:hypothetical protein